MDTGLYAVGITAAAAAAGARRRAEVKKVLIWQVCIYFVFEREFLSSGSSFSLFIGSEASRSFMFKERTTTIYDKISHMSRNPFLSLY